MIRDCASSMLISPSINLLFLKCAGWTAKNGSNTEYHLLYKGSSVMHIIADVILSMGYIFYDFLAKLFEYKLIFLPLSIYIYI